MTLASLLRQLELLCIHCAPLPFLYSGRVLVYVLTVTVVSLFYRLAVLLIVLDEWPPVRYTPTVGLVDRPIRQPL
jgi:hypothetical protein